MKIALIEYQPEHAFTAQNFSALAQGHFALWRFDLL
jgi:hypothetical protein